MGPLVSVQITNEKTEARGDWTSPGYTCRDRPTSGLLGSWPSEVFLRFSVGRGQNPTFHSKSSWHMTLVYFVKFSVWCSYQVAITSGLVLPPSRNALEGRDLVLGVVLLLICQKWLSLSMAFVFLSCMLAGIGGWPHGYLSNTHPSSLCPLVIDCLASCVCVHCLGVQLDRATFWQVPQPRTSALDVQRTVYVCQVCVCLLRPRREESSS